MNQARNTALAELGLSNMSQVTTNAQYDAITAAMVAAQTAAKKGDLDWSTATKGALTNHQAAIQAGRVSAMTDLGYKSTDINNPVAVAKAIASYDRNVSQLQGQIDAAKNTGFVMDKRGNPVRTRDINTGKLKGNLMKELSLREIRDLEQMRTFNFNKSKSLSKSKAALAAAAKAVKDETNRAKEDVAKTAVEQAMDIDPGYSGPGGYGPSGGGTSEGAGGVEGSVGDGYGGGD